MQIKPLEEDKSIIAGGDILAEGLIYGLGTFLSEFANDFVQRIGRTRLRHIALQGTLFWITLPTEPTRQHNPS